MQQNPRSVTLTPVHAGFIGSFLCNYSLGERHIIRDRVKYLLRVLLNPVLSYGWIKCLSQDGTKDLWALRPRLATKLQRPYLSKARDAMGRYDALVAHYNLIRSLVGSEQLRAIYAEGLRLMSIRSNEQDRHWDLCLRYFDEFEKEGELTLSLVDGRTGLRIANLTFCLCVENHGMVAVVGGLQSQRHEQTSDIIRETTKHMFGLRPKATVLWMFQEMLKAWGAQGLKAVSDKTHIYQHWRLRKAINFRYDEFWAEIGGVLGEDDQWTLPLRTLNRSREELKPSRRKMHALRYAFLERARVASSEAIARLHPSARRRDFSSDAIPVIELPGPGGKAGGSNTASDSP